MSVRRVIELFLDSSKGLKQLEKLDMRTNNLTLEGGLLLYDAFHEQLHELNGFKLIIVRDSGIVIKEYDLSDHKIRAAEVAILCEILKENNHISSLNLTRNDIDAKSCEYFISNLYSMKFLTSINLSNNPITNEDVTFSAVEMIPNLLRTSSHIKYFYLNGINIHPQYRQLIDISLQVNRSINKPENDDSFNKFIAHRLVGSIRTEVKDPIPDWRPKLTRDFWFCQKYAVPKRTLNIIGDKAILGLEPIKKFY